MYVVDLLKEGGLDKVVKETGDVKFGFATKAQSLLTGWDRGLIPEKVIHLDVDIVVVQSTPFFNFAYAIEPLQVILWRPLLIPFIHAHANIIPFTISIMTLRG